MLRLREVTQAVFFCPRNFVVDFEIHKFEMEESMVGAWKDIGKRLGLSRCGGACPYISFHDDGRGGVLTLDGDFTLGDLEKIVTAWDERPELLKDPAPEES